LYHANKKAPHNKELIILRAKCLKSTIEKRARLIMKLNAPITIDRIMADSSVIPNQRTKQSHGLKSHTPHIFQDTARINAISIFFIFSDLYLFYTQDVKYTKNHLPVVF